MSILKSVFLALLLLSIACAAFFTISWRLDQNFFKSVIAAEIHSSIGTGTFIEELNRFVYRKEGFEQCSASYVWEPLGPTERQVYNEGGDCADKSRLLSAMLRSVRMDSTLVMLQPCRSCPPTHTIVEATTYGGDRVAADPVYDIVWPDPSGGYYGVAEIRDEPLILTERLSDLKRLRGPEDKINFHSRDEMKYGFPKTINWDRDLIFAALGAAFGTFVEEPFLITRPHMFESPKLFLATVSLLAVLVFALIICGLSVLREQRVD